MSIPRFVYNVCHAHTPRAPRATCNFSLVWVGGRISHMLPFTANRPSRSPCSLFRSSYSPHRHFNWVVVVSTTNTDYSLSSPSLGLSAACQLHFSHDAGGVSRFQFVFGGRSPRNTFSCECSFCSFIARGRVESRGAALRLRR